MVQYRMENHPISRTIYMNQAVFYDKNMTTNPADDTQYDFMSKLKRVSRKQAYTHPSQRLEFMIAA